MPHGPHLPVDYFFRSLADDQGPRAIGVVLSGTGTDGTFGLTAIKEAGGITFAQDPATAKYDGMPRSALASGAADFCLAPEGIAEELGTISQHPYLARGQAARRRRREDGVAKLFVLIRAAFGNDLTLLQADAPRAADRAPDGAAQDRAARGVREVRAERPATSCAAVQGHAHQRHQLLPRPGGLRGAQDATCFRSLLEQQGARRRRSASGCPRAPPAKRLLDRHLPARVPRRRGAGVPLQIFGTDIDEDVDPARAPRRLPENIALDVSPERLQPFFVRKDGGLPGLAAGPRPGRVLQPEHDQGRAVLALDLVSCRNLLIYLQPALQKKVLRILHYALKPDGFPAARARPRRSGDRPSCSRSSTARTRSIREDGSVAYAALDVDFGVHRRTRAAPSSRTPAHAADRAASRDWPIARCSSCTDRRASSSTRTSTSSSSAAAPAPYLEPTRARRA